MNPPTEKQREIRRKRAADWNKAHPERVRQNRKLYALRNPGRVSKWRENVAHTVIHTDNSIYDSYAISSYSSFDVFQKENGDAGYNSFLNPILGLGASSSVNYNLAYNMEDRLDPASILHTQEHRTPLYTVEAFEFRDEIIANNGTNNTYHAGAYLYDGLHEGAVRSAQAVAKLLEQTVG